MGRQPPKRFARTLFLVALAAQAACGDSSSRAPSEREISGHDDAGGNTTPRTDELDAALLRDAGNETFFDARAPLPDASEGADAGGAATCEETCRTNAACSFAHCVAGVCVEQASPEGQPCAEKDPGVCTHGACVLRTGCGDGYREAGGEHAEACDDGNLSDTDACTRSCELRVFDLPLSDAPELAAEPRALGVDAQGRALVLALSFGASEAHLWAQRLSARLVPEGPPIVLAEVPSSFDVEPSVVGLEAGWAVAFTLPDDGSFTGVRLVRVHADGYLEAPSFLHPSTRGEQGGARLSRAEGGFVASWLERSVPGDGPANVLVARYFSEQGLPVSSPRVLHDGGTLLTDLALISDDTLQLVAFTESALGPGAKPSVQALRFTRAGLLEGSPQRISNEDGYEPSAALVERAVVLAYGSRANDVQGDLFVRVLSLADGTLSEPRPLAAAPSRAEQAARVVSPVPGAYAVLFARGAAGARDLAMSAHGMHWPLATAALLDSLAGEGTQRAGALARTRDGVLVAFADDSRVDGHVGTRVRALLLPTDDPLSH